MGPERIATKFGGSARKRRIVPPSPFDSIQLALRQQVVPYPDLVDGEQHVEHAIVTMM